MNANQSATRLRQRWLPLIALSATLLAASAWLSPAGNAQEEGDAALEAPEAQQDLEAPPSPPPPGRRDFDRPRPPFEPPSFDEIDSDGDGVVTRKEYAQFNLERRRERRGPEGPPPGRAPRHHGDFEGPPPGGPHGGPGEFRRGPHHEGPPPGAPGFDGPRRGRGDGEDGPRHGGRHGGPGEFRGGPPHGGPGEFHVGPPRGGRDEMHAPPRPQFGDFDTNGDGSISQEEFDAFRPTRGPRHGGPGDGPGRGPRSESFE